MTDLGASIGGSLKASDMAAGIKGAAEGVQAKAKDIYQNGFNGKGGIGSTIDDSISKVDRTLFDSGKLADKDREKKEAQNKEDRTNRSSLNKAGDKAVDKFKNSSEGLVKLSEAKTTEEKNKILQGVRNDAMIKKGQSMGLSEGESKRLINQKRELQGDDLISLISNAWNDRDIKNQSLGQQENKTSVTGTQYTSALNKASDEEKSKLSESALKGDLRVTVNSSDKASQDLSESWENLKKGNFTKSASSFGRAIKNKAVSSIINPALKVIAAPFKLIAAPFKAIKKAVSGLKNDIKATDALAEEGAIRKMTLGTNWSRNEGEKNLIGEKVQETKNKNKDKEYQKIGVNKDAKAFIKKANMAASVPENRPEPIKDNQQGEVSGQEQKGVEGEGSQQIKIVSNENQSDINKENK